MNEQMNGNKKKINFKIKKEIQVIFTFLKSKTQTFKVNEWHTHTYRLTARTTKKYITRIQYPKGFFVNVVVQYTNILTHIYTKT